MPYKNIEDRRANRRAYYVTHKKQISQYGKDHYARHKESVDSSHRNYYRYLKTKVIAKYGGACNCCKEARREFLTAHHINGGGSIERQRLNQAQFRKLHKEPKRKDIKILCFNCHLAITYYGYCPHEGYSLYSEGNDSV